MLVGFLITIHVIVSLFIVGVVLLQQGKSADLAMEPSWRTGFADRLRPPRRSQPPHQTHHLVRHHLHGHIYLPHRRALPLQRRPLRPLRHQIRPGHSKDTGEKLNSSKFHRCAGEKPAHFHASNEGRESPPAEAHLPLAFCTPQTFAILNARIRICFGVCLWHLL